MAIPAPYDTHPLMLAPVMQMLLAIPESVLWVVGDTWVRCEHGEYFIGADEKVSWEHIYELLLDAQGDAYPWDAY
ncbi:hypothetical protein I6U33_25875 [Pseudomonas carnis]|uniref:hypothetical protein n=1 Tax=Pseudomonas carnis TaxID=2487355 RepID=UPI001C6F6F1E|nr:hypothetical protein [Pseudomonas carnis]MBW9240763.1 hypothetical protein [Pseudomonas carnis]